MTAQSTEFQNSHIYTENYPYLVCVWGEGSILVDGFRN